MIQFLLGKKIDNASTGSRLGIARAENHSLQARMYHGSDTHRTGFQRDIQLTIGQAVIQAGFSRISQSDDFGVGTGVMCRYWLVETSCNNLSIKHDYRTDRDFARLLCQKSLRERFPHEPFI